MHTLKRLFSTPITLIILSAVIVLASIMLWLNRIDTETQGLQRIHRSDDGYSRIHNWLWMTIEGDEFTPEDGIAQVNHVEMSAYVRFGESGEKTWRIAHTGNVTVLIDGETIFTVEGFNELRTEVVTFTIENPQAQIDIIARVDINTPRNRFDYRTEFGIYEQSTFGRWSLIPAYRLYQNPPDEHTRGQHLITQIARLFIALSIATLIVMIIRSQKITLNRNTWIVIGIVALSLMLRFIVMWERFYNDLFFHFIVPAGDDNYVLMGQQLLSGDYDLAGTFWPSAPIVWFAGIVALCGSQLWKIYIANILLSGLATAAVTVGAWQAFDNKRSGILSGLIFALYPPLIFYQVTPQSVVLDAALASFALFFGVMAIKRESFTYSALFGVMIALGGMSRGIALLLGVAFFIGLVSRKPIKGIQLTAVAAIFSILTLLPQDFANYRATGHISLIPYSNGEFTLYSGNNRDADGIWTGRGTAWEIVALTDQQWTDALIDDFQQDPLRMIELNLRKFAMFWNNHEYVSNVNYEQQGLGRSSLIKTLSANGAIGMALLSFFVWIGMVHLTTERKRESHFIFWSINALIFGTILFVLAGRLRMPVMPFLAVAAAVGVSSIWDVIENRKLSTRFIAGIAIAIMLSLIFPYLDANLPRKGYGNIPETAIQRDYLFNNEIRLVGFDPIETNYEENGYFYISLYWEILSEPTYDYRVFVEIADENGRITGVDVPLGSITYPPLPATELQVGNIIKEGYLISLPETLPDVASINAGIYVEEAEGLLVAPDGQMVETPLVNLFDVGFERETVDGNFDSEQATYYLVGDLTVTTFENITPYIDDNNQVVIEAIIESCNQVYQDDIVFVQVLNENGESVAQSDSPIIANGRTTSSMRGRFLLSRRIALPDDLPGGTYRVIMGAYEYPSIERLAVIIYETGEALPDNIIEMGAITIEN